MAKSIIKYVKLILKKAMKRNSRHYRICREKAVGASLFEEMLNPSWSCVPK